MIYKRKQRETDREEQGQDHGQNGCGKHAERNKRSSVYGTQNCHREKFSIIVCKREYERRETNRIGLVAAKTASLRALSLGSDKEHAQKSQEECDRAHSFFHKSLIAITNLGMTTRAQLPKTPTNFGRFPFPPAFRLLEAQVERRLTP